MININGNISEVYVGSTKIAEAYIGSEMVYSAEPLPYDAKIEYLESTGTQWIDPNYTTNSNSIISVVIKLSSVVAQRRLIGNSTGYFEVYVNGNKIWGFASNGKTVNGITGANTSVTTLKIDNVAARGYITIGASNRTVTITKNTSQYFGDCSILGRGGTVMPEARLYSVQIYDNTTPIRDMIPVRVGTTGYMYDKVSKTLFGNAGTGDFVLGNDIT